MAKKGPNLHEKERKRKIVWRSKILIVDLKKRTNVLFLKRIRKEHPFADVFNCEDSRN